MDAMDRNVDDAQPYAIHIRFQIQLLPSLRISLLLIKLLHVMLYLLLMSHNVSPVCRPVMLFALPLAKPKCASANVLSLIRRVPLHWIIEYPIINVCLLLQRNWHVMGVGSPLTDCNSIENTPIKPGNEVYIDRNYYFTVALIGIAYTLNSCYDRRNDILLIDL